MLIVVIMFRNALSLFSALPRANKAITIKQNIGKNVSNSGPAIENPAIGGSMIITHMIIIYAI